MLWLIDAEHTDGIKSARWAAFIIEMMYDISVGK